MRISCLDEQEATWNPDTFLKMYNLRFLEVEWLDHVPTHLPGHLRVLDWLKYPLKSLPSSFESNELVRLRLHFSEIEQLWIGRKVIVLLIILTTLHLNLNKLDTRKLINLTSFLTFFSFF